MRQRRLSRSIKFAAELAIDCASRELIIFKYFIFCVVFLASVWSTHTLAQTLNIKEMNEETGLSCSAILCLASVARPAECVRPIVHFFSIVRWKFWETLQARLDFLNLCPVQGAQGMDSMKSVIVRGAGNCDAAALNVSQYTGSGGRQGNEGVVLDSLPHYCSAYFAHDYVRLEPPQYVGTPARGGYWVEAKDYALALAAYAEKWIEIDRRQRMLNGRGNGN